MTTSCCIVLLMASISIVHAQQNESKILQLPEPWQNAWSDPPGADRPLKIVHELGDEAKARDLLT